MRPILLGGWLVALISCGLLFYFLQMKRLLWGRDWFFILFYAQSLLYLNVSPMLYLSHPTPLSWSGVPDESTTVLYVLIEVVALVFFQIPLIVIYKNRIRRNSKIFANHGRLVLNQNRVLVLGVMGLLFSALFLYVMVSSGLFRAITIYQNAGLPSVYVGLPTSIYVLMRLFQESGLFLSGTFLLMLLNGQSLSGLGRFVVLAAFLSVFGTWLMFYLVNGSRSFMVIAVLLMLGVIVTHLRPLTAKRSKSIKKVVIVGLLVAVYLLKVAYAVRFSGQNGLSIDALNPLNFSFTDNFSNEGIYDFRYRFDGLDGMVMITPRAMNEGFALGQAWTKLAYVTVAQIFDRSRVADLKLDRSTDPKMYLIFRYTNHSDAIDWPNSILFDLYGNFSIFGIFFGGWLFASMYSYSETAMFAKRSSLSVLFALLLLIGTMQFESTFLAWFFSILNTLPVFVMVTWLRPFSIVLGDLPTKTTHRLIQNTRELAP